MYMTRTRTTTNIRMFCPLGPRTAWWPDISYKYVCALRLAGLEPRLVPIGGMQLGGMTHVEHDRAWHHWKRMGDDGLFTRGLKARFVNIVCAPIGFELGGTLRMSDFGKPPEVPGRDPAAARDDEVIRKSSTALVGLWTADMINIAITGLPELALPSDEEVEALRRYTTVICPTMHDVNQLFEEADVSTEWYTAARLAVEAPRLPCFAEVLDA